MNEFLKYLRTPKGPLFRIIRVKRHPNIRGIVQIEHQTARFSPAGQFLGWRTKSEFKTVYDPSLISDGEYAKWIYEARQYALAHGSTLIQGRYWIGKAKNGLEIEGYTTAFGEVKTGYGLKW